MVGAVAAQPYIAKSQAAHSNDGLLLGHAGTHGQLRSSQEPSHRFTSHRIGLARLHRLNYTFIM